MTNEVQKFDPSTLMQGVRDRIKATFVSLIPDEQWEQMVQKEIDDFFNKKNDNYYSSNKLTAFQQIVIEELNKMCREKISAFMATEVFKESYMTGVNIKDSFINELASKAPEMLLGMISTMIGNAMSLMRSQAHQNGSYY